MGPLRGVSGLQRSHALTFFNRQMFDDLQGDIKGTVLDYLVYAEKPKSRSMEDIYLKDVLNTFFITEWREVYGLNVVETMELEFHTYHQMKRRLEEYKREYRISKKKVEDQMEEQALRRTQNSK